MKGLGRSSDTKVNRGLGRRSTRVVTRAAHLGVACETSTPRYLFPRDFAHSEHEPLMSIKSDRWIRRMAREHGMIEPFEDRQVRRWTRTAAGHLLRRVLLRLRHAGRAASSRSSPTCSRRSWTRRTSTPKSFVEFEGDVCIVPPEQLRAGPLGRVLPHPAQRADDLRRQVHLRPLRHHHQRHAVRAGVGGLRDARDLATPRPLPGQDLRERGHLPGAVLRGGRGRRAAR